MTSNDVAGKGPFTFEWTKDGIPVGTDSCLIIEEATEADEGEYCLRVEGACGDPVVQCVESRNGSGFVQVSLGYDVDFNGFARDTLRRALVQPRVPGP